MLAPPHEWTGEAPAAAHAADATAGVLVLDADPEVRNLCRSALADAGFRVRIAETAAEVVERIRTSGADIVLMDAGLAGLGNIIRCIRECGAPKLPGIILAGYCLSEALVCDERSAVGADELIQKPIRKSELLLRVRMLARTRCTVAPTGNGSPYAQLLSLLADFTQSVVAADTVDGAAGHLVHFTVAMTGCRKVSVLLPVPDDGVPRRLRVVQSSQHRCIGWMPRADSPILRLAYALGEDWIVNTPCEAAESAGIDPLLSEPPYLALPLRASGCVVGVLVAAARLDGRRFDLHEVESLGLLAGTGGAALREALMRRARDEARESIVYSMSRLAEQRDLQTGRHLERVTQYCLTLAGALQQGGAYADMIDEAFIRAIERAAPLHDIGKVAVPDGILLKPGPLTAAERARMQTHTTRGWETLAGVARRAPDVRFLAMAADIAHAHHERFDGGGYPRGLRAEDIPLAARLLAVADVYDALSTQRPYKPAFSHAEAREILLSGDGTVFDPHVLAAFFERESEFERLARDLADPAA